MCIRDSLDTVCSQFAAMSQMPGFDRSMLQKQLDGAMSQLDSTCLLYTSTGEHTLFFTQKVRKNL